MSLKPYLGCISNNIFSNNIFSGNTSNSMFIYHLFLINIFYFNKSLYIYTTKKPMALPNKKGQDFLKQNSKPLENSEVFETSEFLFTYSNKNRPIDEGKVLEFMRKFKTNQNYMREFPALICITTWVILDGQHRIEACKRLSIPFCYRWTNEDSGLTIDNVASVQANAGWKTMDYVHSFIKQGKQDYVVLNRFIARYNLPPTTAVMILSAKGPTSQKGGSLKSTGFYTGNLKVENETEGHILAKRVLEFGKLGFECTNRNFVMALMLVMKHPDYNHTQMIKRFTSYGNSIFHKQVNTLLYVREFEKLYNYSSQEQNRLRFS